jgi:3'-phosphoadenosine 5'-phosphosulfate sulfotransferase
MFCADSNACTAILDRFDGVFDLEVAAVGGEDRIGEVIACPYRGL